MLNKRVYVGFLMILMQRLGPPSTSAIRTTLERRLEALQKPGEHLSLFPFMSDEEWGGLDGQEQVDTPVGTRLEVLKKELAEVGVLLEVAQACERAGPDAKAEEPLEWIHSLQREQDDPELKILGFTEIVPTPTMLRDFLTDRGFTVPCLNGSMNLGQRKRAREELAEIARTLISMDAGGEGLNLQFCHAVINHDILWNSLRIELRIGRIDRIGQTDAVRVVNLLSDETVKVRVKEVLEEKLTVIPREFRIEKASDVLDSARGGQIFEHLYVDAILHPEAVDKKVESVIDRVRNHAEVAEESKSLLGLSNDLISRDAQRLKAHPLPHWVEHMTFSCVRSNGGVAARRGMAWDLAWPDGCTDSNVVLTLKDLGETPTVRHLTLSSARVRGLAMGLPRFAPSKPIWRLELSDLLADVLGYCSLRRIGILGSERSRWQITSFFLLDDGRCLTRSARHVWNQLLTVCPEIRGQVMGDSTEDPFSNTREGAETQGRPIRDELVRAHHDRLSFERGKGEYAFCTRRHVVERIGLPAAPIGAD